MSRMPWRRTFGALAQVGISALLPMLIALQMRSRGSFAVATANFALTLVFLLTGLVIHELGHAVGARCAGLEVHRICVGGGPVVWRWQLGRMEWRLGSIPSHGYVIALPRHDGHVRGRFALTLASGPLFNLACVVGVAAVERLSFADVTRSITTVLPWHAFAFANALLALMALVPLRFSGALGPMSSDGLALFGLALARGPSVTDLVVASHAWGVQDAFARRDLREARSMAELIVERWPDNGIAHATLGEVLLAECQPARAREQFITARALAPSTSPLQVILANNIAWAAAMAGDPDLLPEAEALSRSVITAHPRVSWANGTRGAVLVALGRTVEGRNLLQMALETNDEDRNRAHNAAWLAVAAAADGDTAGAERLLDLARALDPDSPSIHRAQESLSAAYTRKAPRARST